MRPIEFRGKRIDNGQWVYGDLVHVADGTLCISEPNVCIPIAVLPETVGQYVGIKLRTEDKRKVFEGDLLEIRYYNGDKTSIEVKWSEHGAGFHGVRVSGTDDDIMGCQYYSLGFSGSAVEGVYHLGTVHDEEIV